MAEYDEDDAVAQLAVGVGAEMQTERFRFDQAAREDVIKLIRAVGRSVGDDVGTRQLGPYRTPPS